MKIGTYRGRAVTAQTVRSKGLTEVGYDIKVGNENGSTN